MSQTCKGDTSRQHQSTPVPAAVEPPVLLRHGGAAACISQQKCQTMTVQPHVGAMLDSCLPESGGQLAQARQSRQRAPLQRQSLEQLPRRRQGEGWHPARLPMAACQRWLAVGCPKAWPPPLAVLCLGVRLRQLAGSRTQHSWQSRQATQLCLQAQCRSSRLQHPRMAAQTQLCSRAAFACIKCHSPRGSPGAAAS